MTKDASTVYRIRVPDTLLQALKKRAAKERRTLHAMMLLALEWGLSA